MKSCPICKAQCFEDMEICYGCMHRFDAAGGQYAFGKEEGRKGPGEEGGVTLVLPKVPQHVAEGGKEGAGTDPGDRDAGPCQRKGRHALASIGIEGIPAGGEAMGAEGFQAEYELVISLKPRR